MENYDLLSLYKYKTNVTGASAPDTEEYEEITVDENETGAITSERIGGDDVPDYQLVTSSDSVSIGGKEVDALGTLSDEDVEEGIKAQKQGESVTDTGIYKTLGQVLDKLKQLISWVITGKKPGSTDPEQPIDPDQPSEDYVELESDGTDGNGPSIEELETIDENLKLSRGQTKTVTITSAEQVLTLVDPFGGANYQYTLTSTNGSSVNTTFEFLKNGRLVVRGDNIKMVANKNQKDDIILMGNNCELDTGDGDDTVRVGFVKDSRAYRMTETTGDYLKSGGVYYYATTGNKIHTGSGNDYVSFLGMSGEIDTGSGGDHVASFLGANNTDISNAEQIYALNQKTTTVDGYDGWVMQGTDGDCRFLALINSICGNRNIGKLSDYVTITKSGTSYTITFKNYHAEGSNKNYVTISQSDLNSYTGVYGDIDTVLTNMALNRLIANNTDRENWITASDGSYQADTSVSTAYYNTLAKYLLGNENVTFITNTPESNKTLFETRFIDLWNEYKNGNLSNFTVGIQSGDNNSLGIISGHAYSVRNVVTGTNGYVELINPWDDADCLRLSLSEFFNLSLEAFVYGRDYYNERYLVPNGGTVVTFSSNDVSQDTIYTAGYIGNENPFREEIQEVEQNIEQVKALINAAKNKTIEELS